MKFIVAHLNCIGGLCLVLASCQTPGDDSHPINRKTTTTHQSRRVVPKAVARPKNVSQAQAKSVSSTPDMAKVKPRTSRPSDYPPVTWKDCVDCHPDTVDGFRETGMGRALYRPTPKNIIEDFGSKKSLVIHPVTQVQYRAFIDDDGRWWQEESLPGTDYKKAVEVKYIIGSGNHTRSYLAEVEGNLIQMPLTWYTKKKIWDMSPGYEGAKHYRFTRPVRGICLFCHNDLTPINDGTRSGYMKDLEQGISCVRCHGDGREHVATRLAGKAPPEGQPDPSIFNPGRQPLERQLHVCQQCHLAGKARVLVDNQRWDTYDPRTPLPDYMSIYSYEVDGGSSFGIASHGNRLALSACFKKSKGTLNCTVCHDPHKKDVSLGRKAACLTCHKTQDCGAEHGLAMSKDCSTCHMYRGGTSDIPHVTFTDHFIRKQPEKEQSQTRGSSIKLVDVLASQRTQDTPEDAALRKAIAHARRWRFDGKIEHQAEALRQLKSALKAKPQSGRAWSELAMIHKALGEYRMAESAFGFAEKFAPDMPDFWLDFAEVEEALGKLYEAESRLRRLIHKVPNDRGAWNNLANVLFKQNKIDAAEKAYEKATSVAPTDALVASNRGFFELKRGRLDEAEKWFDQALKNDGIQPMMYSNLGTLAVARKDFKKARLYYEKALSRDKDFAIAYWMLGRMDVGSQDWVSARKQFETMIKVAPRDPRGYLELGAVHLRQKNAKEALKILIKAQLMYPQHPQVNALINEAGRRLKDTSQAP